MGELVIEDDCFAPRKFIFVEYSGPDPFVFVREFRDMLRPIFEVGTSNIGEPRWMWDWTGDPIQLYVHWLVRKKMTDHTTFLFSIRVVGFKSKSKNEGNFRMEIEPVARHKIEYKNWFTKAFWWLYWYLMYGRIRQSYIENCRDYANRFINAMKEMYNLKATGEE